MFDFVQNFQIFNDKIVPKNAEKNLSTLFFERKREKVIFVGYFFETKREKSILWANF